MKTQMHPGVFVNVGMDDAALRAAIRPAKRFHLTRTNTNRGDVWGVVDTAIDVSIILYLLVDGGWALSVMDLRTGECTAPAVFTALEQLVAHVAERELQDDRVAPALRHLVQEVFGT